MISTDIPPGRVLPPSRHRARRFILWGFLAFFFFVVISPQLITLATDLYWYREIGFETVFSTSLKWRAILFLIGGAVTFAFLHANMRLASSGVNRPPIIVTNAQTGEQTDLSHLLPRFAFLGALTIAFVAGISASTRWMLALQELNAVPSGRIDPVFGRDISFYFFQLPALERVIGGLTTLTTLTLIFVGVVYLLSGAFSVKLDARIPRAMRGVTMDAKASRHLGALLALYFVLIAADVWFVKTASLLFNVSGPLVGAGYTDVHVRLPALRLSAIIALVGAAIIMAGVTRGKLVRSAAIAIALYIGVAIVGRGIVPSMVQRFSVIPNELARETPYLQRHLEATRQAWALDSVTTRDLTGDAQLTLDNIRANSATIENVRLWERDLVQQTFGQLQEIRTYYDFVSVTDDRYVIDGRYRQVHLAARELNAASLPTRTFINEHLTFTHGMGVTMAPVNQVTSEGLPVLFLKDLPPASTTSLKLTRPQIYFGEMTNNYVFVGTGQDEFDYPSGDGNATTRYSGTGGVKLGSLARRLMYAWQFRSMKILLSNDIADSARILYRRNIEERAKAALPFLSFDTEPYVVVSDSGTLKWILDGYTGTDRYPYAQRVRDGLSYMRNSVKVVIDAYDGSIDAYIVDERDPLIRTVAAIFPAIFKPMSAMPADVRRHIRFPGDLFRIQAQIQATYHMREPETFYHREDQWQIPGASDEESESVAFMRHIILRLPGEANPEFIYMTPFTPRGKDNLAAWMVARMDGDHYGEMVVYRFPKQSLIYGPKQVANRINQDTDISRELTLWDQRGSEVIRGELLVIPIEESLMYVQPIFLRAAGGTIPELKRVVVAQGNRVVMRETLESGLAELFGGSSAPRANATATSTSTTAAPAASTEMASLLQRAQEHYDRAIAAQRAGNWADYGKELEALGAVLKQLRGR